MATNNADIDMSFEDIMFGDHETPKQGKHNKAKSSSDIEDVKGGVEANGEGGETGSSNASVNNFDRNQRSKGSFSSGNSFGKRTSVNSNQGFGNGNNRRKASGSVQAPKWEIENAVLVSNFKPDFDMKAVVDLFEQECGKIKASNLKGDDKLVIQFSEAASCEKALQKSFDFEGTTLLVNSSSSKSTTSQQNNGTSQNGDSSATNSPIDSPNQAPTDPESLNATLVLKNLPFHVKHDKLQEILTKLVNYSPKYVRYHHDSNGAFRGIAFVKYRSMEDATNAFNILNNSEVMTRKIRCEYKKKGSSKNKTPQLSNTATATTTTATVTSGTSTTPTKTNASDVNLDDSEIKEIHDRLMAFKDDPIQSELSYPATINNSQRKTVLKLCDKFGLVCIPKNDCLTVKKKSDAPNLNTTGQNTASKPIGINSKRRGSNSGLGSFGGSYGANSNNGSLSTSLGRPPQSNSSSNPVSVPSSLEKTPRGSYGRSSLGASPGSSPMFRSIRAQSLTQVIITPKGPDGTKGFAAGRGKPLAPPTHVAII